MIREKYSDESVLYKQHMREEQRCPINPLSRDVTELCKVYYSGKYKGKEIMNPSD